VRLVCKFASVPPVFKFAGVQVRRAKGSLATRFACGMRASFGSQKRESRAAALATFTLVSGQNTLHTM